MCMTVSHHVVLAHMIYTNSWLLLCNAQPSACIYVRHVNVQRQSGLSDCGIFAIAFATALCMGIDPYTLNIDQNKSPIHLLKCFEQKNISAFPLTERPRRITGKRVATTNTIKLFCVCHMPYKKDDLATPMAQCFKCMKWYHQRCVEISSIIFKDKYADFVCKLCL